MDAGSTWPAAFPKGLKKKVAAWEGHRNKHHANPDWQFTLKTLAPN
jgi:hypothetical protein